MTGISRGFWAVTRHADVAFVSRNPELFCSSQGVGLGNTPADVDSYASFVVMDPPRQTAVRRVVNGAFTPKRVKELQDRIEAQAIRIVDEFVECGNGDVVEDFSQKLPLWTICEILGVPESRRPQLSAAAEVLIAAQDVHFERRTENGGMAALKAGMAIHRIARAVIADRRAHPGDDILSALCTASSMGSPSPTKSSGTSSCSSSPPETKRPGMSRAMHSSCSLTIPISGHSSPTMSRWSGPPSKSSFAVPLQSFISGGRPPPIRCWAKWTSPRATMSSCSTSRRTATRRSSKDPETFDITRSPNPHVGFGGGGPHFCLGANLARAELRALFTRLAERVAAITAGEPRYLVSSGINSIDRMPVEVRRAGSLF